MPTRHHALKHVDPQEVVASLGLNSDYSRVNSRGFGRLNQCKSQQTVAKSSAKSKYMSLSIETAKAI